MAGSYQKRLMSMKRVQIKIFYIYSPIRSTATTVLDSLIDAKNAAEELRNKLAHIITEIIDDEKIDSSMSSLALDVSKISVLKVSSVLSSLLIQD